MEQDFSYDNQIQTLDSQQMMKDISNGTDQHTITDQPQFDQKYFNDYYLNLQTNPNIMRKIPLNQPQSNKEQLEDTNRQSSNQIELYSPQTLTQFSSIFLSKFNLNNINSQLHQPYVNLSHLFHLYNYHSDSHLINQHAQISQSINLVLMPFERNTIFDIYKSEQQNIFSTDNEAKEYAIVLSYSNLGNISSHYDYEMFGQYQLVQLTSNQHPLNIQQQQQLHFHASSTLICVSELIRMNVQIRPQIETASDLNDQIHFQHTVPKLNFHKLIQHKTSIKESSRMRMVKDKLFNQKDVYIKAGHDNKKMDKDEKESQLIDKSASDQITFSHINLLNQPQFIHPFNQPQIINYQQKNKQISSLLSVTPPPQKFSYQQINYIFSDPLSTYQTSSVQLIDNQEISQQHQPQTVKQSSQQSTQSDLAIDRFLQQDLYKQSSSNPINLTPDLNPNINMHEQGQKRRRLNDNEQQLETTTHNQKNIQIDITKNNPIQNIVIIDPKYNLQSNNSNFFLNNIIKRKRIHQFDLDEIEKFNIAVQLRQPQFKENKYTIFSLYDISQNSKFCRRQPQSAITKDYYPICHFVSQTNPKLTFNIINQIQLYIPLRNNSAIFQVYFYGVTECEFWTINRDLFYKQFDMNQLPPLIHSSELMTT